VRSWLTLSRSLIVGNIDELVIELETSVGLLVLTSLDDWKITKFLIPPAEELSNG
jgi:hypothetical protein